MYKLKVDLIFCDYFYILPVARLARALLTILSFQKSTCDPLCSGSASDELQLDVRFCDPSYQEDYKYKCRHVQPSTMDQFSKSHAVRACRFAACVTPRIQAWEVSEILFSRKTQLTALAFELILLQQHANHRLLLAAWIGVRPLLRSIAFPCQCHTQFRRSTVLLLGINLLCDHSQSAHSVSPINLKQLIYSGTK